MKFEALKKHLPAVMGSIAVVWLILYLTVYDKSYYHIDTVREPMIRFLFMESMLLGAWFRQNDDRFRNHFKVWYPIAAVFMLSVYFSGKIIFSQRPELSEYQILNQLTLFVLLAFLFMTFSGLDGKLEKMPKGIIKAIDFLASMTLEIYVVQYVLISLIRPVGHFPLNWIVLTGAIVLSAFALHKVCEFIYGGLSKLCERIGKDH